MNEDNYDIDKYFQEIRREAAEQERAKIVAWLKSKSAWLKSKSHHAGSRENELAEAIEAGEHLKRTTKRIITC